MHDGLMGLRAVSTPREAGQSFFGSFFSKKELLLLYFFEIFARLTCGAVEQDQWTA
jgi:hypothetical protein